MHLKNPRRVLAAGVGLGDMDVSRARLEHLKLVHLELLTSDRVDCQTNLNLLFTTKMIFPPSMKSRNSGSEIESVAKDSCFRAVSLPRTKRQSLL